VPKKSKWRNSLKIAKSKRKIATELAAITNFRFTIFALNSKNVKRNETLLGVS
jgi:hypothetical protein